MNNLNLYLLQIVVANINPDAIETNGWLIL